jgi:hypothetical protein
MFVTAVVRSTSCGLPGRKQRVKYSREPTGTGANSTLTDFVYSSEEPVDKVGQSLVGVP